MPWERTRRVRVRAAALAFLASTTVFVAGSGSPWVVAAGFAAIFLSATLLAILRPGLLYLLALAPAIVLGAVDPRLSVPFLTLLAPSLVYALPRARASPDARAGLLLALLAAGLATASPGSMLLALASATILAAAVALLLSARGFGAWIPLGLFLFPTTALVLASLGLRWAATIVFAPLPPLLYSVLREVARVVRQPTARGALVRRFVVSNLLVASVFCSNAVAGAVFLARSLSGGSVLGAQLSFLVLLYGAVGAGYFVWRSLRPDPRAFASPFVGSVSTAWAAPIPWLAKAVAGYAGRLRRAVVRARSRVYPPLLVLRFAALSLVALFGSPALGLAVGLAIGPIPGLLAGILLCLGAALGFAAPLLVLELRAGSRRKRVEEELPWFALYSASLQAAGIPLFECLRRIRGKGLLKAIEEESEEFERKVVLLGRDPITAVEELANEHPSKMFRDFVVGYTSILRSGGDLVAYLESRVREYLSWLSFSLRRYAEVASNIGEILLAVFTILVSVFALAGGVAEVPSMKFLAYFGMPAAVMGFYAVVSSSQPWFRYDIKLNHFLPAIALAVSMVLATLSRLPDWMALSIAVLSAGALYGIQYEMRARVARAHEQALEDFLRDLTEQRKVGLPPSAAVRRLARNRSYNRYFDALLRSLAAALDLGLSMPEAVERVRSPSWLTRMILFVVAEIDASGGGTVGVLERLTEFVSNFELSRRETRSRTRIYEILALASPFILGCLVSVSAALSSVMSVLSSTSVPAQFRGLLWFTPSRAGLALARTLTVESSVGLGILASKVIDGSVASTWRAVAAAALSALYFVVLDPAVQSAVERALGLG